MKKTETPPAKKTDPWLDHLVETYGDLLYDLCQSLLWSTDDAPIAFRRIIRKLRSAPKESRFIRYERAWIFRLALQELHDSLERGTRRLTPAEQVMLDSNPDPKARLRHFDSYFHRLDFLSQSILLLRDKYGLPFTEISAAVEAPEDSLKLKRAQALRQLQTWVWSADDAVL